MVNTVMDKARRLADNVHVQEEEEVVPEDGGPEDDGRSLLSAGWGIGHDGSGIDSVIDAEFVSHDRWFKSGRQNRSQLLFENQNRL
ncbi:hypothetical protein F5890DRAFT_1537085 [Lentinula detonsa]|uniref:Uncharacterized protein n=1 Tax=Lentinula detonsa TaxID=2804962 RepID=A0AA38UP17_9AGAR|nr:hypothetical protein F5890DRAFT_1537085 [Lentinula detonsa]